MDDEDAEKFPRDIKLPLCPLGPDTPKDVILVWDFWKAPKFLQKLSENGGDEDGICWIPNGHEKPFWIERLWNVYGEPDKIRFTDGVLYIWAHA